MVIVLVVLVVVLVVLVVVLSAALLPRMESGERQRSPHLQRAALQLICLCPLRYLLLVCR